MTRSYNKRKGDNGNYRKNKSGSKKIPRKWWNLDKLMNKKSKIKNILIYNNI
jgi:hypothetical protein